MQDPFTVHCIAWHAGAPLLREVRAAAYEMHLKNIDELLTDEMDEFCRHALALSKSGRAIGCARITPEGTVQRMLVLPIYRREEIEAAMVEVLNDYQDQMNSRTPIVPSSRSKPHAARLLA